MPFGYGYGYRRGWEDRPRFGGYPRGGYGYGGRFFPPGYCRWAARGYPPPAPVRPVDPRVEADYLKAAAADLKAELEDIEARLAELDDKRKDRE